MAQIFGPVPSRRLGLSLGVDTVPLKTCTLDCIYCQLGRTTNKTLERSEYVPTDVILREVEQVLQEGKRIDYITFSGSGEPTLHSKIGTMVRRIKKLTSIPVAILTNGTLLHQSRVREGLMEADLVIPSLDTVTPKLFEIVNRPHPQLRIEKVIGGIHAFSQEFEKRIWLEIMVVRGINDARDEIERMASVVKEMNLEKVQLNTVIRPPAETFAQPLSAGGLREIKKVLGKNCEIISRVDRATQGFYEKDVEKMILRTLTRRPMTLADMEHSLGLHPSEVVKYLEVLERNQQVEMKVHNGEVYYHH